MAQGVGDVYDVFGDDSAVLGLPFATLSSAGRILEECLCSFTSVARGLWIICANKKERTAFYSAMDHKQKKNAKRSDRMRQLALQLCTRLLFISLPCDPVSTKLEFTPSCIEPQHQPDNPRLQSIPHLRYLGCPRMLMESRRRPSEG